jgi:nucleoside-diphosphate-sugar epimerase
MRVLVMGGSRFMGPRVIETLVARGHEVTAFNRGTRDYAPPVGARQIVGDRNESAALAQLRPADFEVVVDMSAYLRAQTESLLDFLGAIERWVHISSGAVYRPPAELPWPESTTYGPWALWGTYAIEKLGCELALRGRRAPSKSTICLRFPMVLGPANFVPREEFVFNRLLDRGEILIPGDGHAVVQFVSTVQVGQAVASAVELEPQGWHAFNIANPTFASLTGFVELCAEIAGVEATTRPVPQPAGPFDAYDAVFPFPNENYVLDISASIALGLAPDRMTITAMLRDAYDHLMADPRRRSWERTNAEKLHLQPA